MSTGTRSCLLPGRQQWVEVSGGGVCACACACACVRVRVCVWCGAGPSEGAAVPLSLLPFPPPSSLLGRATHLGDLPEEVSMVPPLFCIPM